MTGKRRARGARKGGSSMLDAPTVADHRRIRNARREARASCREIEAARDVAVDEAFRAELGATVRSASPLLIALLAKEGLDLDEAVALLQPLSGWPARPRLSGPKTAQSVHTHLLRYYSHPRPSLFSTRPPTQISQEPLLARTFYRADGKSLTLLVVDHSLEVEARIGPVSVETRFGELSIQFDRDLPATVFVACLGRLVEEIVDHESWRGRGWRIAATEEADYPWGQRLFAATGAVPYRMPWARQ